MKILIDTHIAIWAVLNDPKLPGRAKDIILDEGNEIPDPDKPEPEFCHFAQEIAGKCPT